MQSFQQYQIQTVFLILFSLQLTNSQFADYNEEHNINCNYIPTTNIIPYIQLQKITLHDFDRYYFIIFGVISIFSTLFIIITYIIFPNTRKQPGDIMLAISISDLILTLHWMNMSAYYFYEEGNGDNKNNPLIYMQEIKSYQTGKSNTYCIVNAIFSTTAGAIQFLYNTCFCIFLIFLFKNKLVNTQISPLLMHGSCIGITIVFIGLAIGFNQLGLNLFGTCSIKVTNSNSWFGLLLLLLYLIVSWYMIIYFLRQLNMAQYKEFKKEFYRYYLIYVLATSIIWTITAVANMLAELNCQKWQDPSMEIVITIGNISKLCTPIILSVIRYKDPYIKDYIRVLLSKLHIVKLRQSELQNSIFISANVTTENNHFNNISLQQDLKDQFLSKTSRTVSANDNILNLENQQGMERKRSSRRRNSSNWLINLQINMRISKISAIMAGIVISMNEWQQKNNNNFQQLDFSDLSEADYQEKLEFNLSSDLYQKYNPDISKEIQELSVFQDIKIFLYAPKIFSILQKIDQIMVDFNNSFDIQKNWDQIQKSFGLRPDGGRSGEFFFFTSNHLMAIKTMNNVELTTYINALPNFIQHFKTNPDSMISKIYGIMTFFFRDEETNIYIFRNIAQCPKEFIDRTFDLKGSTIQREVLKTLADRESKDLTKITLKDLDFQNTEKYIKIDKEWAQKCSQQLIRDAQFLKSQKLIDYSLLLFKVNWRRYNINMKFISAEQQQQMDNDSNEYDSLTKKFSNLIYIIPSNEEQGIYYQMGIIDYLQVWNIEKKMEKVSKQFINFNMNIDISAQDQDHYSERFIQEIAKNIFRQQN